MLSHPKGLGFVVNSSPGGTAISMSTYSYHHYARYWTTHPHEEYHPERWLNRAISEKQDRVLLTFGKGARQCLGQNLGYATLFLTFAYFFRRFDFELFETTKEDMEWHDGLLPMRFGQLKVKAKTAIE